MIATQNYMMIIVDAEGDKGNLTWYECIGDTDHSTWIPKLPNSVTDVREPA